MSKLKTTFADTASSSIKSDTGGDYVLKRDGSSSGGQIESDEEFDYSDEEILVESNQYDRPSIPNYYSVNSLPVTVIQFILILVQVYLSFAPPSKLNEYESSFGLTIIHLILWTLFILMEWIVHKDHKRLQSKGYLNFYKSAKPLVKVPLYILSAGNCILLLEMVLLGHYCPTVDSCFFTYHHSLQSTFILEAIILSPLFIYILASSIKFNLSKGLPDVLDENLLTSYFHAHSQLAEGEFRNESHVEALLEKQVDILYYLKQQQTRLSKTLLKVHTKLAQRKNRTAIDA